MKIDKRIILYKDNQMSDEERKAFEIELNKSPELSKQMESYRSIMQSFKVEEQNLVDEDYFVNLIPEFRKNLSDGKKTFKIKISYALSAVTLVLVFILVFFNPFKTSEYNSADKIISNLNESEAAEMLNYYSDNSSSIGVNNLNDSSDSLFSELISSELNFQESDLKSLARSDNNYLESIYAELQPEEVDLIYNEILKLNSFRRKDMIRGIFLSVFIITLLSTNAFSQMHGKMKAVQKMEELKKIKLIEILQLDEETSIKFFTRRSEHMRKMEKLNETGQFKIDQIDEMIKNQNEKTDPVLKKAIDEYLQLQENVMNERQNFFKTSSEILTTGQMAKLVVFEEHFRNEVRGLLLRERNRRLRDK